MIVSVRDADSPAFVPGAAGCWPEALANTERNTNDAIARLTNLCGLTNMITLQLPDGVRNRIDNVTGNKSRFAFSVTSQVPCPSVKVYAQASSIECIQPLAKQGRDDSGQRVT